MPCCRNGASAPVPVQPGPTGEANAIDIASVVPSPFQPRRAFDEEALTELANSIVSQGLLQPIVVRPRPQGGYELIAGERRWRAAQQAGPEGNPRAGQNRQRRTGLSPGADRKRAA